VLARRPGIVEQVPDEATRRVVDPERERPHAREKRIAC
jgi:hypothetical protein